MSTTMADPGQAQRMARKTPGKPSSAGGQLNFNPLHPSMELPPEQLIRLLGLEHKTKRRKKKSRKVAAANTGLSRTAEDAPASKPVKLSLPKTTPACAERERDIVDAPFGDSQKRLIVPALIVGAIAGIAISAYLFWGGAEDTAPMAKPSAPAPVPAAASVPATRQGLIRRDEVIPQIKIEAEEKRLRVEAEQRYSERVTEQETILPPSTIIDDISGSASLEAEAPIFTDEPAEASTIANEVPRDTATPPEPASLELQSDGLKDEIAVEALPTEQQAMETDLVPAEPAVEEAPAAAEPVPEAVQDNTSEATDNEALF